MSDIEGLVAAIDRLRADTMSRFDQIDQTLGGLHKRMTSVEGLTKQTRIDIMQRVDVLSNRMSDVKSDIDVNMHRANRVENYAHGLAAELEALRARVDRMQTSIDNLRGPL
jgi:chromosome segregation ATPase